MKKSIVMTLILALIISLASIVNAVTLVPVTSHMSGIPESGVVENGDEFTVSISLTNDASGATETATNGGFRISYNASVLQYVGSNSAYPQVGNGTVRLDYLGNTSSTFTVTFKVIGEKGSESPITFEPIQFTQTDIELKATTVSSKVVVGPVEEEPPVEENTVGGGTTEPEHQNPTGGSKEDEEPAVDENGKPTRIPQTGVNYAVVGGVVIALVAVAAVAKKLND